MDKYEYKLRLEEIRTLNRKGRFQEAAQVADTVDWKKVRSVSTLGIISDVYKINRRFDDAKEILLLANDISPQNRRVIYALCDLTVKMGDVVSAVEYYKEFVQLAPNDNSKYILLYKIYEAQDISLEERISVLKEYKKREYSEKWAYELAFLYHRVGLATECVEECDQLILWFGEGKYVTKAMELKMLYVPLSSVQQQAYDRQVNKRKGLAEPEPAAEEQKEQPKVQEKQEKEPEELDIHIKPMDMGQYNTIDLQAAIAEGVKEVLQPEEPEEVAEIRPEQAAEEELPQIMEEAVQPENVPEARRQPEQAVTEVQPEQPVVHESAAAEIKPEQPVMTEAGIQTVEEPIRPQLEEVKSAPTQPEASRQMAGMLTQEYNGQISLALTEERPAEKQITGQMNIQDVLVEWEKLKKNNEEKRRQETRQWMLQQTGSLFESFDQEVKDGVLERLERDEALNIQMKGKEAYEEDSDFPEVEELEEVAEPTAQAEDLSQKLTPEQIAAAKAEAEEKLRKAAADLAAIQALAQMQAAQSQAAVIAQPQAAPVQAAQSQAAAIAQPQAAPVQAAQSQPVAPTPQATAPGEASQAAPVQNAVVQTPFAAPQPEAVMQNVQGQPTVSAQPTDAQPATAPEAAQSQPVAPAPQAMQPGEASQSAPAQVAPLVSTEASQPAPEAPQDQPAAPAPEAPQEQPVTPAQGESESAADFNRRISEQQLEEHVRSMTPEEKELFAPFVPTKGSMRQLVRALDMISLSAYTGNMVITGAAGSNMMKLAQNVIREVRATDRNFSGKVARISGDVLNAKNVEGMLSKIPNGALIVEKAGVLSDEGAGKLEKALNQDSRGVVVFLLDTKRAIGSLMERYPTLARCFTARFDIATLDCNTLVKYGCQYARNMEYSIDELGRLALHTRIEDLQTCDHAVTVEEVRDIVDEAIDHATRTSPRHFVDILLRKRYDEDDMIVLRERDFI